MGNLRVSKLESKLGSRTEEYGNGNKTVYAKIETGIEIEVHHLMNIIADNWESIDGRMRHEFARKISALDARDSMRLLDLKHPERDFEWR